MEEGFRRLAAGLILGAVLGLSAGCGIGGSGGGGGGGDGDGSPVSFVPAPDDPLFADQWHLKNTGQAGGAPGEDINVEPAWASGRKGEGIRVVVVDDGVDIAHEDLTDNIVAGANHNYLDDSADPTAPMPPAGAPPNGHGTSVAGLIAARDLNGLGGRGVAPRAGLFGYNLLQNVTDLNQLDAMTRSMTTVYVSSNSWGPPDGTGHVQFASPLLIEGINAGVTLGRNGLGTIYVWAAGNGGDPVFNANLNNLDPDVVDDLVDNSNYDGAAMFWAVLAVCAVGDDGRRAPYSERGANLWACAPSEGDNGHALTTTDRPGALGYNATGAAPDYADTDYTNTFNGTSGAAPIVSGTVALMLEANPSLTWRDVRLILAETARQNDPADPDWTINGAGYHVNHNYGFGVADAGAAVARALAWANVGPQAPLSGLPWFSFLSSVPDLPDGPLIPDNNAAGVADTIKVADSGITHVEAVEVLVNVTNHPDVGDLDIRLTSPSGTVSRLAEPHSCLSGMGAVGPCTPYGSGPGSPAWVFSSARHLGEPADGIWTLVVSDLKPGGTGNLTSWELRVYGR